MKVVIIVAAALAVALLVLVLIGSLLPQNHVASRMAAFRRPVGDLYATVRDFSREAEWRSGITAVEMLPDRGGRRAFREVSRHGAVPYVVLVDNPDQRLVIEIADPNLPYGGTWTFDFQPLPEGGIVRITERGFVANPIFRLLSRTLFSQTATMEAYLRELGKKFGEAVQPSP